MRTGEEKLRVTTMRTHPISEEAFYSFWKFAVEQREKHECVRWERWSVSQVVGDSLTSHSRKHAAFVPEGVETLVTGLGPLSGDGQQVRRAPAFDAACRGKRPSEGKSGRAGGR